MGPPRYGPTNAELTSPDSHVMSSTASARPGAIPEHAAPNNGEIGLRIGEALVDAAADDEDVGTPPQPAHQPIADPHVLSLWLTVALHPQQGPIKAGTGSCGRNDAIDVDADLQARIGADHLNCRGEPREWPMMPACCRSRRPANCERGLNACQLGELVEDEAAVCSPDVGHVNHVGADMPAGRSDRQLARWRAQ